MSRIIGIGIGFGLGIGGGTWMMYNEKKRDEILLEKINQIVEREKNLKSLKIRDDQEKESLMNQYNQIESKLKDIYNLYDINRFNQLPLQHGSPLPAGSKIHQQLIEYGLPSTSNLWFYEKFIVSNNNERRIPNWVIQRIEGGDHQKKQRVSDRKKSSFNNNTPHISPTHLANNKDYLGSGWSRGHMIPAGDMQEFEQTAMDQTFLLNSNIVPQDLQNNCNFWYRLEVLCKSDLPRQFDSVTIVSGPIFMPNLVEPIPGVVDHPNARFPKKKERRFIKHEVIGENNVSVPTHLFKVILAKDNDKDDENQSIYLDAFIIPNEPIPSNSTLEDYKVSLFTLEKVTGLEFFNKLRNNNQNIESLCQKIDCSNALMTEHQLETWNIPRRIGWSKNQKELDQVMKDVVDKNIIINDNINESLKIKLFELNQKLNK